VVALDREIAWTLAAGLPFPAVPSQPTVLAIDDDPAMRELIEDTLTAEGLRVLLTADGAAGVAAARERLPDVIVCDIVMPLMDGHAVLAALRGEASTAAIPLIFLTAEAAREAQRKGMEGGADDYVTKPFEPADLVRAVRTQLEKRAAARRRGERDLQSLRGEFAKMLPHELLTPLTPIVGYAGLLRDMPESFTPEELRRVGEEMAAAAARLQRLFENVVLYNELERLGRDPEAAAQQRQARVASIGPAVEEAARRAAGRCGRTQDLAIDVEDAPAALKAAHLAAITEELTDNACKFSEAGARVEVRARHADGWLLLEVRDSGRGMTPEQIRRVGAFSQFDRPLFEQQGSGLGLVIAKRAAELAGGSLTLASAPGEGTLAVVRIPSPA
jgi:signal transduction histidine kinase